MVWTKRWYWEGQSEVSKSYEEIKCLCPITIHWRIYIHTSKVSGTSTWQGAQEEAGRAEGRKPKISITRTKRKSGWNYTRNRTCLLMKQPWSSVIIFKEAAKIKVKGASQWLQVCTALKNTPSVQSTLHPPHPHRYLLPFSRPPHLSLFHTLHALCFSFFSPFFSNNWSCTLATNSRPWSYH